MPKKVYVEIDTEDYPTTRSYSCNWNVWVPHTYSRWRQAYDLNFLGCLHTATSQSIWTDYEATSSGRRCQGFHRPPNTHGGPIGSCNWQSLILPEMNLWWLVSKFLVSTISSWYCSPINDSDCQFWPPMGLPGSSTLIYLAKTSATWLKYYYLLRPFSVQVSWVS